MIMRARLRKFALTIHLTCSVGWIGTVIAYLALVLAAMTSTDPRTLLATWIAMEIIGWYVIVPLALASLLSGLVMALGTQWGLFRHYWVVFSLVLTILATMVLLVHMQTVSDMAGIAVETTSATMGGLSGEFVHAGLGLLVLLVIQVLNMYKPRGMTAYGQRKQRERRTVSPAET
jgi:hypothetical protein